MKTLISLIFSIILAGCGTFQIPVSEVDATTADAATVVLLTNKRDAEELAGYMIRSASALETYNGGPTTVELMNAVLNVLPQQDAEASLIAAVVTRMVARFAPQIRTEPKETLAAIASGLRQAAEPYTKS